LGFFCSESVAVRSVDRIALREVKLLADYPDDSVVSRVQVHLDA
jgi:hypothetical protein